MVLLCTCCAHGTNGKQGAASAAIVSDTSAPIAFKVSNHCTMSLEDSSVVVKRTEGRSAEATIAEEWIGDLDPFGVMDLEPLQLLPGGYIIEVQYTHMDPSCVEGGAADTHGCCGELGVAMVLGFDVDEDTSAIHITYVDVGGACVFELKET